MALMNLRCRSSACSLSYAASICSNRLIADCMMLLPRLSMRCFLSLVMCKSFSSSSMLLVFFCIIKISLVIVFIKSRRHNSCLDLPHVLLHEILLLQNFSIDQIHTETSFVLSNDQLIFSNHTHR